MNESVFLERHEEDVLFTYYERRMVDFCNAFKPAMPKSVVVCVFYLYNIIYIHMIYSYVQTYVSDPCRARQSCTSEDST